MATKNTKFRPADEPFKAPIGARKRVLLKNNFVFFVAKKSLLNSDITVNRKP